MTLRTFSDIFEGVVDAGDPIVADQAYAAKEAFIVTVPAVGGPYIDANGKTYASGANLSAFFETGGTAPADPTNITPAEFLLMTGIDSSLTGGATATYQGLQVQEWVPSPAFPHITGSDQTFSTGIDMTNASHVEVWVREQAGGSNRSFMVAIDVAGQPDDATPDAIDGPYDVWHMNASVINKANGDVTVRSVNWAPELTRIVVVFNAVNGFVIPTGTQLVTPRSLVVTSPTATPDITIIEEQAARYFVNVTAGQRLVLGAVSDVTVELVSALDGVIIAQATGPNPTVTFTETPVSVPQVQTFQQDNAAAGPATPIEGWQFDMRSDSRQIRIYNSSGKKRMIRTANAYRESTGGGDGLGTANLGARNIGMDAGDIYGITTNDLAFNSGGGAAAGDVEYAVVDVWEFDDTDRLLFTKIHTLHVSCAVGNSFVNNDWRVEVIPA